MAQEGDLSLVVDTCFRLMIMWVVETTAMYPELYQKVIVPKLHDFTVAHARKVGVALGWARDMLMGK